MKTVTLDKSSDKPRLKIVSLAAGVGWTNEDLSELSQLGEFTQVSKRPQTPAQVVDQLRNADYAIVAPLEKGHLSALVFDNVPRLRGMSLVTNRYNWVDIEAAQTRGLIISTLGNYAEIPVAEFALGLILDLARRITMAVNRTKAGLRWFEGFQGFELHGKTLGIIGLGSIGTRLAQKAKGIGINVIGYNRTPLHTFVPQVSIETLLHESHIVSMNLALNNDTGQFLSREMLLLMNPEAILVNVSPEGLIDQGAVYEMLIQNRLAGYGFEVDELKIHQIQQRLLQLENVIATPHTGWYTTEAVQRLRRVTIENLRAMITGKPINNVAGL